VGVVVAVATGNEEVFLPLAYFIAIGGAIVGAICTFAIVNSLSDLREPLYDPRETPEGLSEQSDSRLEGLDLEGNPAPQPGQHGEIYHKDDRFHQ
jgi:hypothetical protein